MEVNSALTPPRIRLSHMIRRYSLRILQLNTKHPVSIKLQQIRDSKFLYNYISDSSKIERRIYKNRKQLQIKCISNSINLELINYTKVDTIISNYYAP